MATETETKFEVRLSWNASSNVSFRGRTDWEEWGGFEETEDEIYKALEGDGAEIPDGLSQVLDACGFAWGVEVREVASDE